MSRAELLALLHTIVCELPRLREGSAELHCAHANLQLIRRMLMRSDVVPR